MNRRKYTFFYKNPDSIKSDLTSGSDSSTDSSESDTDNHANNDLNNTLDDDELDMICRVLYNHPTIQAVMNGTEESVALNHL